MEDERPVLGHLAADAGIEEAHHLAQPHAPSHHVFLRYSESPARDVVCGTVVFQHRDVAFLAQDMPEQVRPYHGDTAARL